MKQMILSSGKKKAQMKSEGMVLRVTNGNPSVQVTGKTMHRFKEDRIPSFLSASSKLCIL